MEEENEGTPPPEIFDGTKYIPHIAAEPSSPRRPPCMPYDFAEL